MDFLFVIMVAAAVFGLCFLVDKLFTKIFRNKAQHISGFSVRFSKKYGSIGLILFILGIVAVFSGLNGNGLLLCAGGVVVAVVGIGLVVYYITFGVFYDNNGFVLTTFGKRSITYPYNQIAGQMLYTSGNNIIVELHMNDGRSVGLQSAMIGVYPFLDTAFENWCRQTGRNPEECEFHDPDNSLWFPSMEGK